jgi:hypothetical protein
MSCPFFLLYVDISFRAQVGVLWMRARAVLCRSRTSCHCRKLDLLGFLIVNENPRLMSCWIPGPIKMANLRCWEHKKVRPSSGAQQYLLACGVLCVALHYCIALLDCCLAWYGTVRSLYADAAPPPGRERRS